MVDSVLSVDNLWLMKVWEMAGTLGANPVNMQTKNSQPYNLRPNDLQLLGEDTN